MTLAALAMGRGGLSLRDSSLQVSLSMGIAILLGISRSIGFVPYDILKDIWHFGLPVVSLAAGWVLAEGWSSLALQLSWLRFSVVVSMGWLFKGVWISFVQGVDFADKIAWRMALGPGEFISVWGVLTSFHLLRNAGGGSRLRRLLYGGLILNLASIMVSDSRTALVLLLAGFFFVFLPAEVRHRRWAYWLFILGGVSTVLVLMASSQGDANAGAGRLQNMLTEQFNSDFSTTTDIHEKYRAFESLAALNTYLSGSWLDILIGHGFGKLVDLGTLMVLGVPGKTNEYQYVPILHNGYLYLLVKTGFLGFLMYLVFLGRCAAVFLKCRVGGIDLYWPRIGLAILVGTVLATMVMSGPFNNGDFFTSFLLLGSAMRMTRNSQGEFGSA